MLSCLAQSDVPCIYGMLPWWAQLAICIVIYVIVRAAISQTIETARWIERWGGMPALLAAFVALAGFIAWLWKPAMVLVGIFGPKPKKPAYEFGRAGKRPSKKRETFGDWLKRMRQ